MTNSQSSSSDPRTSITKETVEHYLAVGDSLAGLIANQGLRVRDFVLLSFVRDQGPMDIAQLVVVLGLGQSATLSCLDRLEKAGLVQQQTGPHGGDVLLISPTTLGIEVINRIDEVDQE